MSFLHAFLISFWYPFWARRTGGSDHSPRALGPKIRAKNVQIHTNTCNCRFLAAIHICFWGHFWIENWSKMGPKRAPKCHEKSSKIDSRARVPFWSDFGSIFEWFWANLGSIWGWFWNDFDTILAPILDQGKQQQTERTRQNYQKITGNSRNRRK